jgi:hypothetical protein
MGDLIPTLEPECYLKSAKEIGFEEETVGEVEQTNAFRSCSDWVIRLLGSESHGSHSQAP